MRARRFFAVKETSNTRSTRCGGRGGFAEDLIRGLMQSVEWRSSRLERKNVNATALRNLCLLRVESSRADAAGIPIPSCNQC